MGWVFAYRDPRGGRDRAAVLIFLNCGANLSWNLCTTLLPVLEPAGGHISLEGPLWELEGVGAGPEMQLWRGRARTESKGRPRVQGGLGEMPSQHPPAGAAASRHSLTLARPASGGLMTRLPARCSPQSEGVEGRTRAQSLGELAEMQKSIVLLALLGLACANAQRTTTWTLEAFTGRNFGGEK